MNLFPRLVAALILGLSLALPVAQADTGPAPFTRDELRVYLQRMENGDLQAYHEIGAAMLRGDRLAQDVEGALENLNHAADRGHVDSLLLIANWYLHTRDGERARPYVERALATGDPRAHYGFVQILDSAWAWRLFPDDAEKKRRRLESLLRAANGNIPEAMNTLAWHYAGGDAKDPVREFYWFEQAAMHGHRDSIVNLARLLKEGASSEWPAAAEHHQGPIAKVAAQNPQAGVVLRYELGVTYDLAGGGDAVPAAAHYFEQVMNDEKADGRLRYLAQLRYARLAAEYGSPENRAGALKFFNDSAAAGSVHAQCFLASEMEDEHGLLPHDAAAAERWEKRMRSAVHTAHGLPASCGNDRSCQDASAAAIESICNELYGD